MEIQKATKNAINVPFEIMKTSFYSIEIIMKMAEEGNPNSISDAGVAMHCARAAIMGAFLNVKINCKDLDDKKYAQKMINKGFQFVTGGSDIRYITAGAKKDVEKLHNNEIFIIF